MGGGTGCNCRDGTFFILALKTVYMGGGTGHFSFQVYMRMFLPRPILPGTICKVSIISSQQSGTECLYDTNKRYIHTVHSEILFNVLSWQTSRSDKRPILPPIYQQPATEIIHT